MIVSLETTFQEAIKKHSIQPNLPLRQSTPTRRTADTILVIESKDQLNGARCVALTAGATSFQQESRKKECSRNESDDAVWLVSFAFCVAQSSSQFNSRVHSRSLFTHVFSLRSSRRRFPSANCFETISIMFAVECDFCSLHILPHSADNYCNKLYKTKQQTAQMACPTPLSNTRSTLCVL